jgi:tRNA uridine 5-carbamoylmethylation protein Kti12
MSSRVAHLEAQAAEVLKLRINGEYTDIVLAFDGDKVSCHRVILAASSEYFRRTLKGSSANKKVKLKKISGETGRIVVEYLYSGIIEVTVDNAVDLQAAADFFELKQLQRITKDFIQVFIIS